MDRNSHHICSWIFGDVLNSCTFEQTRHRFFMVVYVIRLSISFHNQIFRPCMADFDPMGKLDNKSLFKNDSIN